MDDAVWYLGPEEDVNNKTKTRLRQIYCRLDSILDEKGISDVVEGDRGFRYPRMDKLSCDFEYKPAGMGSGNPGNLMKEGLMKEYWWRRELQEVQYAEKEYSNEYRR